MAISDTGREEAPFGPEDSPGSSDAPDGAPEFDQPPQLALGDEDVRLPWLEGDEDEEDEGGGSGAMQGMLLVLLGLVAIGVIVGGLFWAMRDRPDAQLVADGGVITAPKEPYKTRPDDPGGDVVDGTGDTSFAVAEGQTRQPRIDSDKAAAEPGFDAVPAANSGDAAPAPAAGGVGVQVGAYSSQDAAEAGWTALKSQYPALAELSHRVVQGKADIGTVYRLQAVASDRGAARSLCSGMKSAGLSCQVKD